MINECNIVIPILYTFVGIINAYNVPTSLWQLTISQLYR